MQKNKKASEVAVARTDFQLFRRVLSTLTLFKDKVEWKLLEAGYYRARGCVCWLRDDLEMNTGTQSG